MISAYFFKQFENIGGSAVGITTGYGLDDRGVRVRAQVAARIFTSPYRPAVETTHQKCTGGPFPGLKRPGREVDHSPTNSAEIKKTRVYTFTAPFVFTA
jgi:hypothetical protein